MYKTNNHGPKTNRVLSSFRFFSWTFTLQFYRTTAEHLPWPYWSCSEPSVQSKSKDHSLEDGNPAGIQLLFEVKLTPVITQTLTCLTRSGLTVVCGCSMLTGSGFWALWGISRTFSAMKLWTLLSASTVPCMRQTRSVVPVRRQKRTNKTDRSHLSLYSCTQVHLQDEQTGDM